MDGDRTVFCWSAGRSAGARLKDSKLSGLSHESELALVTRPMVSQADSASNHSRKTNFCTLVDDIGHSLMNLIWRGIL